MRPSASLLSAVVLALSWARQAPARLLLDAPLGRLEEACQIVDGRHPSHSNCSKAFRASTTCVESWPVQPQNPRPGLCGAHS